MKRPFLQASRAPAEIATAERLATSIEAFIEQESLWVRAGDCVRAAAAAARNSPLISRLEDLGRAHPAVCLALGCRIAAMMAKRRQNQICLQSRRAVLLGEIERNASARGRLQRLAPVYAGASRRTARFNAAV